LANLSQSDQRVARKLALSCHHLAETKPGEGIISEKPVSSICFSLFGVNFCEIHPKPTGAWGDFIAGDLPAGPEKDRVFKNKGDF
jgi:hypothetical protein